MTTWYTADPHFGHENVIDFCDRPFESAEQMDRAILDKFRDRIQPDDELWILGDFAFGEVAKKRDYLSYMFGNLPGRSKHLVVGNHDGQATLELPWTSVHHIAEVRDGSLKQNNTLCHYPMVTWNHSRRGAIQLFGHVHNNWLGSRNSVNVGVDVWDFAPVTMADIEARARALPVNSNWKTAEDV